MTRKPSKRSYIKPATQNQCIPSSFTLSLVLLFCSIPYYTEKPITHFYLIIFIQIYAQSNLCLWCNG